MNTKTTNATSTACASEIKIKTTDEASAPPPPRARARGTFAPFAPILTLISKLNLRRLRRPLISNLHLNLRHLRRLLRPLILISNLHLCGAAALSLHAQSTYIIAPSPSGTSSGTWFDLARWSDGNIPNAIDAHAVINNSGSIATTITIASTATLGKLDIFGIKQDPPYSTIAINGGTLAFHSSSGEASLNTA